jgi:uncharacterized protein (DUF2237 family)
MGVVVRQQARSGACGVGAETRGYHTTCCLMMRCRVLLYKAKSYLSTNAVKRASKKNKDSPWNVNAT